MSPVFEALLAEKIAESREQLGIASATPHRESVAAAYGRVSSPEHARRQPALSVEQVMVSPVERVTSEAPIAEVDALMKKRGFRHVPIVSEDGGLIGIVSDRDVLRATDRSKTIATLMTTRVLTATPGTSIREAAAVMLRERVSALPVIASVAGRSEIAGILTVTDILRAIVERAPIELWV